MDTEVIEGVRNLYFVVGLILLVAYWIYQAICLQVIAQKTTTAHSWFAWFPVLNAYLGIKIARRPGWWLLLLLVPVLNAIIRLVVLIETAWRMRRSGVWGLLAWLPLADIMALGYLAASPKPDEAVGPEVRPRQIPTPYFVAPVVALVCVGAGLGAYFALRGEPEDATASTTVADTPRSTSGSTSDEPAPSTHRDPVGVPSTYTGFFTSVDGRERCFARDDAVTCYSPSGKGATLVAGISVAVNLAASPIQDRGGSMPKGTSFTTPSGFIECKSSRRGIECYDLVLVGDNAFIIGDHDVVIINGGIEERY